MDLRTLAVDAYVGVKLKTDATPSRTFIKRFCTTQNDKYLLWCHNITHFSHKDSKSSCFQKPLGHFLQGQYPTEQLPHTPSRDDIIFRYELSQQRALLSRVLIRRGLSFSDHCTMPYVRLCHHKSVLTVSFTVRDECNIQQIFKETQVASLTKSANSEDSVTKWRWCPLCLR